MKTITTPSTTYTPPGTSVIHKVTTSLDRRAMPLRVHLVQYDKTIPIVAVSITFSGQPYTIPEGAAVNVRLKKADGKHVYDPVLGISENRQTVYVPITAQMTTSAGQAQAILEIVSESNVVGTAPLYLDIDKNPVPEDAVESSDEFMSVHELVSAAWAAAEAAESNAASAADSAAKAFQSETAADQSAKDAEAAKVSAETARDEASRLAADAKTYAENAQTSETNARLSEEAAEEWATKSKSYAVGGTGTRAEEDVDNSKYYYEQARRVSEGLSGALLPMGTIAFEQLAAVDKRPGDMYNISDAFVTDDSFVEGEGHHYPVGTNVYCTADNLWDCLAGATVATVNGETGDVQVTLDNLPAQGEKGQIVGFTEDNKLGAVPNDADTLDGKHADEFQEKLKGIADYIVEQGTSGIWTYRRWKSGIVEAWGSDNADITESNAIGGMYYSNIIYLNPPMKLATLLTAAGNADNLRWITNISMNAVGSIAFRLLSPNALNVGSKNTVRVSIVGKV